MTEPTTLTRCRKCSTTRVHIDTDHIECMKCGDFENLPTPDDWHPVEPATASLSIDIEAHDAVVVQERLSAFLAELRAEYGTAVGAMVVEVALASNQTETGGPGAHLAAALRAATNHAQRAQAVAAAAVTLAAVEPLHHRPTAYCAVTVRRPEAGGTGVTVTVAGVGGAA